MTIEHGTYKMYHRIWNKRDTLVITSFVFPSQRIFLITRKQEEKSNMKHRVQSTYQMNSIMSFRDQNCFLFGNIVCTQPPQIF